MLTRNRTDFSTTEQGRTPILHTPHAGNGGKGSDRIPPVCISFPGDDRHPQRDEAARMRDRLADMLDGIGMRRIGGPIFEEDIEEEPEAETPQTPATEYQDPYIVVREGPFALMTWGEVWLIDAQGGCNA